MPVIPPAVGIVVGGAASVAVGIVRAEDDFARYADDGGPAGIWTDYRVMSRYEKDGHRYMMPMTSPDEFQGASVAFVQLAAPTLLWIVDWTAARFATPPDIPDERAIQGVLVGGIFIQSSTDWVLLDQHLEPAMITVGPDGVTPLYRISGTYVYGHKKPHARLHQDVNFPYPPWLNKGINRQFPDGKLKHGIID